MDGRQGAAGHHAESVGAGASRAMGVWIVLSGLWVAAVAAVALVKAVHPVLIVCAALSQVALFWWFSLVAKRLRNGRQAETAVVCICSYMTFTCAVFLASISVVSRVGLEGRARDAAVVLLVVMNVAGGVAMQRLRELRKRLRDVTLADAFD